MANDPFADLARELPDEAFWPTGAWFKRVFAALTADRVRAGANLTENPTDKGRYFAAQAGGDGATAATPAFTVVAAATKDQPGRVRVYTGTLGGLRPDEMTASDDVAADGTDNRCFLVLSADQPQVWGKVLVDPTGKYTSANVYVTDDEDPDGTYAYLLIADATFNDDGTISKINQDANGNQSLTPFYSADGSILWPGWSQVSS